MEWFLSPRFDGLAIKRCLCMLDGWEKFSRLRVLCANRCSATRAQSLADGSGTGLRIAVELIRQKLIAQERLVRDDFRTNLFGNNL